MTKLSLCVGFSIALLVGLNCIPSLVYAQTDEEAAQPSEPPQTDNTAQPDQAATPDESTEEQGDETGAVYFSDNVAALLQRAEALMLYFCVVGPAYALQNAPSCCLGQAGIGLAALS